MIKTKNDGRESIHRICSPVSVRTCERCTSARRPIGLTTRLDLVCINLGRVTGSANIEFHSKAIPQLIKSLPNEANLANPKGHSFSRPRNAIMTTKSADGHGGQRTPATILCAPTHQPAPGRKTLWAPQEVEKQRGPIKESSRTSQNAGRRQTANHSMVALRIDTNSSCDDEGKIRGLFLTLGNRRLVRYPIYR